MAEASYLRRLADAHGIVPSYVGTGGARVVTTDATRVALLAAMGVDAADESRARELWNERVRSARRQRIDPVRVVRRDTPEARLLPLRGIAAGTRWEVEIETPEGETLRRSGRASAGQTPVAFSEAQPYGRYRLRLATGAAGEVDEQTMLLVPSRCVDVVDKLGAARGFGLCANLYSVRDGRSDFGDFSTLKQLVRWAGAEGAAFVGVNPLCATRGGGSEISPYSPTTRLFRSALYLDLTAIPEWEALPPRAREGATADASDAMLDYEAIRAHKQRLLRRLHAVFVRRHGDGDSPRGRAYHRFLAQGGATLEAFAIFCVLDELQGTARGGTAGWRQWPAALRDPASPAVVRVAREHAREVDFFRWLQFEIDRQLAACAASARRAGLRLGIYQDLPIAAVPSGFEEWSMRSLFCAGASVGAPPDAFFAGGQNWSLAPWNPQVLRGQHFAYWQQLLRAAFAHAGALRVDHVMGLARQYWIPAGGTARDGAYVRMPAEELFGILALESQRAGAVVIGEDLGTVPEEIPPLMERWGVLSTKVLYFETTASGGFRAPSRWPRPAFISANTHDLATLEGFEVGRDLELHHAAGILDAAQHATERTARGRQVAALRRWAKAEPGLSLTRAVYRRLAHAPSVLLGVSLDDLAGEIEPINLPGVGGDVYPSWRRRMRQTVRQLARDAAVRSILADVRAARTPPRVNHGKE